jgi:hypothetical protein
MAKIRIHQNLAETDFTKNFVHLANQEQIRDIVFKYNLASKYPQSKLTQIGMPTASKIVEINGARVHLILSWSPDRSNNKYSLWAFPDEQKYIEKYSLIFDTLYDIFLNRYKKSNS